MRDCSFRNNVLQVLSLKSVVCVNGKQCFYFKATNAILFLRLGIQFSEGWGYTFYLWLDLAKFKAGNTGFRLGEAKNDRTLSTAP